MRFAQNNEVTRRFLRCEVGTIPEGARLYLGDVKVAALNRHPVKSMQGEHVDEVRVDGGGIEHDRRYGILDRRTGCILSAKWEPRLLDAVAMQTGPELVVKLPTGETVLGLGAGSDAALSAWLGRPVHLQEAGPRTQGTYQSHVEPTDDDSEEVTWTGPVGRFVDEAPLHVLTTASLHAMEELAKPQQWDARRFRPNVVVDVGDELGPGFVEDDWVGGRLRIGEVELEVVKRTTRCSMVGRAQPGGIRRDLGVIRSLRSHHELTLGVHARVIVPGVVRRGDRVEV